MIFWAVYVIIIVINNWFFCKSRGVDWLPLTRELSSEARLRERKAKFYIYFYSFSPSVTAKPCHLPRQREVISVETPTLGIEPNDLKVKKMLNNSQQRVFEFLKKRINDSIPPTVREICEETGLKSTSTVHAILKKLEEMGLIERDPNNSRSIRIAGVEPALQVPVLGQVQAGMPTLAVEDIECYIPFTPVSRASDKEYFALRVRGDSMINAAILEDDIVVCEKTPVAYEGEIVVALIDGDEATVKRFYREGCGFRFQPENDNYDPIYTNDAQILGKVIAVIRSYD